MDYTELYFIQLKMEIASSSAVRRSPRNDMKVFLGKRQKAPGSRHQARHPVPGQDDFRISFILRFSVYAFVRFAVYSLIRFSSYPL
jgi:hypothetical protein